MAFHENPNRPPSEELARVRHSPDSGRRVGWVAVLTVVVAALIFAAPGPVRAQAGTGDPEVHRLPRVTPTIGSSWLEVRGTTMQLSAMGQQGRSSGEIPQWVTTRPGSELSLLDRPDPPALTERISLTGADLYRLSCRSCHAADGSGSPPEIKPLIDPIRATSAELTLQQMEARGRPIPRELAETLSDQATQIFLERLDHGGERMPVYDHLADDEVDALFAYLQRLARVPGAPEETVRIDRSVARVGELLIKGTCHTCHAAAGRGGGPEVLQRGMIPSLDTFPLQLQIDFLIRKVTEGAPIDPSWRARGRMPVFSYLTEDEVRAAYVYLLLYPPRE